VARGGRRGGAKGGDYPNRTDLRAGPLAATAPRGLPYGERQQLMAAQRAVPMGTPTSPGGGPAPQSQPSQQGPLPGTLPFLHPTARPNEPVTAGIPLGPGPGPEALTGVGAGGFGHSATADMLSQLAAVPGASPEVANLAAYAQQAKA